MLTRLENMLSFKRYEKLGSNADQCYIRIRVITNRVILRFKCICFLTLIELVKCQKVDTKFKSSKLKKPLSKHYHIENNKE